MVAKPVDTTDLVIVKVGVLLHGRWIQTHSLCRAFFPMDVLSTPSPLANYS